MAEVISGNVYNVLYQTQLGCTCTATHLFSEILILISLKADIDVPITDECYFVDLVSCCVLLFSQYMHIVFIRISSVSSHFLPFGLAVLFLHLCQVILIYFTLYSSSVLSPALLPLSI